MVLAQVGWSFAFSLEVRPCISCPPFSKFPPLAGSRAGWWFIGLSTPQKSRKPLLAETNKPLKPFWPKVALSLAFMTVIWLALVLLVLSLLTPPS
jgi:hypothetical protein